MNKIKLNIIFLILFCAISNIAQAQLSEQELKAAFIERFTRFIEWPSENNVEIKSTPFQLSVLGKNTLNSSLDELFGEVKIKNREVKINYINDLSELNKADILFVCSSEKKELPNILAAINNYPVLVISDTKGFAKTGTHINLFNDGNYIRYEINQDAIEKSGLKVSSLLLASAKIVKSDD